jgi:hypothetical protein
VGKKEEKERNRTQLQTEITKPGEVNTHFTQDHKVNTQNTSKTKPKTIARASEIPFAI